MPTNPGPMVQAHGKKTTLPHFWELCKRQGSDPVKLSAAIAEYLGTRHELNGHTLVLWGKYTPFHLDQVLKEVWSSYRASS